MQEYRRGRRAGRRLAARVRYGAGTGADDGQAVRESLGIGHAVTFETGGEHEHVGFRVKRREALRRYRAERGNSLSERVTRDIGSKLRRGIAVAGAVAGNRQPP